MALFLLLISQRLKNSPDSLGSEQGNAQICASEFPKMGKLVRTAQE
jgi:hypothetical protein